MAMTLTTEFLGTFSLTTSASFWGAGGRFWSMSLFVPHNASPNRTYAALLKKLGRFEEAKSLMRKSIPVARRVLGSNNETTLKMRMIYAKALYEDPGATLDDLHEAVTTLEEIERTARRVLGGAHPVVKSIEAVLRNARARACETLSTGSA